MAQYDGSIRINTEINAKNAKAQLMTLENRIVKTADKIASLRSKMDSLKDTKIPTSEYKNLEKEATSLEKKLLSLYDRQERFLETGGKENSTTYKRMVYDAEQLEKKLQYAEQAMQALVDSGKAFTLGSDTQEYANLGQQLKYAENEMDALTQKHEAQSLKVEKAEDDYKKLGSRAGNALKKIGSMAKKHAISSMQQLGNTAKKAGSFIKGIASKLLDIGKSAKSASGGVSSMGMGFKNLLKYGLRIRSLFVLVNKFRSAAKEGFSNLYNASGMESFKNTVDSLRGSLLTLKNSFAAAFQPLVQIAIPYIQKAIEAITALMDKLGQFFAAATGQKTYTKAVKQTADAFKKAKKAADGYLSPLDEINKFQKSDDKSDEDSGATGKMFETAQIENSIRGFVDKIKGFFYNEDWQGLGSYMASGINAGLQKVYDIINWNNVGPKITYFINAFTSTINSLVDNIDWGLLGRTIGAGLNTALKSINMLVDGIDWVNLGAKLSTGLNGFVNEVDFAEVGKFFGNKFKVLNETMYGFVTNLNFDNIGLAIADGLNGLGSRINLTMLATSLYTTINGLFNALGTFIQEFDWNGLASNIYNGINTLITNIDWGNIASTLSSALRSLFGLIINIVKNIDWEQIGLAIWDFIAGIDWIGLIKGILTLAWELLVAAVKLIIGLFSGIWDSIKKVFAPVGEWFGDLFSKAVSGIKNAFSSIGSFFSGIWSGIQSIFGGVANWFGSIFKKAWEGVKNVFSAGGKIFDGIKDGIANVFKTVVNGLIGGINKVIAFPFKAINGMLNTIRSIDILGFEPFSWIKKDFLPVPQIPKLATGAVIPPNKEFLAVLGDQKHGTNIEAPLETIKQAFREEALSLGLGGSVGGGNITLKVYLEDSQLLNPKKIFEAVITEGKVQQMSTGKNRLLLET